MGGMAAQIPIKNDPAANEAALAKVRADKEREAGDGHDGTWVAHPGLVPVAMEVFDRTDADAEPARPAARRRARRRPPTCCRCPTGAITEAGLRNNISVGVQYLEAWLRGNGCVPLYNLMEDAATAEISRAQIWQWVRHPGGVLADGRKVTRRLFRDMLAEELAAARRRSSARHAWATRQLRARAAELLDEITTARRVRRIPDARRPIASCA